MKFFEQILKEIQPLLPGLVTAGIFIATLVALRLLFRRETFVKKLRLPAVLLWIYLLLAAAALAARLYWPKGAAVIDGLGVVVLGLAIVLAVAFGIFDVFLGRYRQIEAPKIVRDIVVVVIYLVVIFVVLSRHGVNLSSILTTSAVVTAILGLALQDLLSNIVAGIALQIERPFAIDDWVLFDKQEGRVLEMNWRSTKIQTLHNDIVVIPNNVITRSAVVNFTQPDRLHRRKLTIGLRYEAAPGRVKASLLRAVKSVPGVVSEPEPFVLLRTYADFSINYKIHFFIDDFENREVIEDAVRTRLWYQLRRDGLSVPFPIRDINVRQVSEASEQAARERDVDRILEALDKVPFLEPLSARERRTLAAKIRREQFAEGEAIIREGGTGNDFYIIADGRVEVRVGGRRVAELSADDFFGEMSLMTGEARSATVVSTIDSELYVISKSAFTEIIEAHESLIERISEKLTSRRSELELSAVSEDGDEASAPDARAQGSLVNRIRRFFNLG